MDIYNPSYADILKGKLNKAIADAISEYREYYEGSSGFSRSRKLDLETMIKLLLYMDGGCLEKNCMKPE